MRDNTDDFMSRICQQPPESGQADVTCADEKNTHREGREKNSDFHGLDFLPFGKREDFFEDPGKDTGG